MAPEYGVLLTIIGLVLGFVFGRFSGGSSANAATQAQLDKTNREFEQYKQDVSEHFSRTAALNETLIQNYQKLFEHLGESAKNLLPETDPNHQQLQNQSDSTLVSQKENQPKDYSGSPSGLLKEQAES